MGLQSVPVNGKRSWVTLNLKIAQQHLFDPTAVRAYDNSAMGTPIAEDAGIVEEASMSVGGVRYVKNMSMKLFCSKLVEHFDIKWRRGEIVWPNSRGKQPKCYVDTESYIDSEINY